jgi:hypothetical protein
LQSRFALQTLSRFQKFKIQKMATAAAAAATGGRVGKGGKGAATPTVTTAAIRATTNSIDKEDAGIAKAVEMATSAHEKIDQVGSQMAEVSWSLFSGQVSSLHHPCVRAHFFSSDDPPRPASASRDEKAERACQVRLHCSPSPAAQTRLALPGRSVPASARVIFV